MTGRSRVKGFAAVGRWMAPMPVALVLVMATTALAQGGTNVNVNDRGYVAWGHDPGYMDATLRACSADKRQQNEPTIAQDPRQPNIVVAGANDYCSVPTTGDTWAGFYISHNHGANWTDSLLPGYPTDKSSAGLASPIRGIASAGDPVADWDNLGNLFYGGIAFDRARPADGTAWVATYGDDGSTYLRTVVVAQGTPSPLFLGKFNDHPTIKVDQWGTSKFPNRVYLAWALFMANGNNAIVVSHSADHGRTFSQPTKISDGIHGSQDTNIAIAPDGTVYVFWRTFAFRGFNQADGIAMAMSKDGGVSWSGGRVIMPIVPYDRSDQYVSGSAARDCGDGPFRCVSNFTFHRADSSFPSTASDASGNLYLIWPQLFDPHNNGDTYHPDGQAQIVVAKSVDGGAMWSKPRAIDRQDRGHQFWGAIAYGGGALYAVYYDSRNDPAYSEEAPPGNWPNGNSSGPSLDLYASVSTDGGATWVHHRVSDVSHNPNYEMFGNRRIPFHGDYIWVTTTLDGSHAHVAWTDNRDVVPGVDPRDAAAHHSDGDDVMQCRAYDAQNKTWGPDTCPSAGGLNQNIEEDILHMS